MKTLTYNIIIDRPVELVFNKIMDKTVYADWAKAWSDGMTYEGEWKAGANISFFDKSGQGTKVVVEEIQTNDSIKMKHTAMVESGNKEVPTLDETMKKWIGSQEDYFFKELADNKTEFTVIVKTDEAFEPMMQAWNKALLYFKEVCETN